jgi:flavin reductase (DIM6/NTAB) family NADH-FMN oxidoreductase RutF
VQIEFGEVSDMGAYPETSRHFYEPVKGHGLAHDPLNAIIAPRPIGWISTRSSAGTLNLAPYSFFNAFNYKPPIIGFSSVGEKDSLRNARASGEFVWNLAVLGLAEQLNMTSATVAPDVCEFELANLTPAPSLVIATPRVAESPVNFECKVTDIVRLKSQHGSPLDSWLVLGEVVGVHILKELIVDGVFDTFGSNIILRAGGPADYAHLRSDNRFQMIRPK